MLMWRGRRTWSEAALGMDRAGRILFALLVALGAGLGAGIVTLGAAKGIGHLAGEAMGGIARQPEAGGRIFTSLIIAAEPLKFLAAELSGTRVRNATLLPNGVAPTLRLTLTGLAEQVAFFESKGLYAFDMDGKLVWEKDFGDKRMRNQFGEGSTPALYRNRLVVVWDQQGGQSFVVALNKKTGEELWRVNRDEIDTWATPLVVEHGGRTQVVINGSNRIRAYDLETGKELWQCGGMVSNPIPTPVVSGDVVFCMSGYRGYAARAIRLGGSGDLADTAQVLWKHDRGTPYVASPADPVPYIMFCFCCGVCALVSFCSFRAIGMHDGPVAGLVVLGTGALLLKASMVFFVLAVQAACDKRV